MFLCPGTETQATAAMVVSEFVTDTALPTAQSWSACLRPRAYWLGRGVS